MAQLVEQLIRNQQAAGSSPASSSRREPGRVSRVQSFLLIYGFALAFIVVSIL